LVADSSQSEVEVVLVLLARPQVHRRSCAHVGNNLLTAVADVGIVFWLNSKRPVFKRALKTYLFWIANND